jgi:hypothetical protein
MTNPLFPPRTQVLPNPTTTNHIRHPHLQTLLPPLNPNPLPTINTRLPPSLDTYNILLANVITPRWDWPGPTADSVVLG